MLSLEVLSAFEGEGDALLLLGVGIISLIGALPGGPRPSGLRWAERSVVHNHSLGPSTPEMTLNFRLGLAAGSILK